MIDFKTVFHSEIVLDLLGMFSTRIFLIDTLTCKKNVLQLIRHLLTLMIKCKNDAIIGGSMSERVIFLIA